MLHMVYMYTEWKICLSVYQVYFSYRYVTGVRWWSKIQTYKYFTIYLVVKTAYWNQQ